MKLHSEDKEYKRKYKGLKLMTRSMHITDEFVWATWYEIRHYKVFSYRLVNP